MITIVLVVSGLVKFPNESSLSAVLFLVILYGLSFIWNIILLLSSLIPSHDDHPDAVQKKNTEYGHSRTHDKKTDAAFCTCLFPHPVMFLIGLVLFLLCDINVMIYNMDGFVNVSSSFYHMLKSSSVILMWAFYLPSQVLIVLSAMLP